MKPKSIRIATPASTAGTASVSLNKKEFDATIENQGYNVWIDRAVKCPCKDKNINNTLSSCKNCGSTGWVFINRLQTKAIVYSMEWKNSYKEWSEENLGNVYITIRDENKLSFMDRVTIIDADTIHKQVLYPFEVMDQLVAFTIYRIKYMIDIFLYQGDDKPLRLLQSDVDYFLGSSPEQHDTCNGVYDNVIRFSDELKNLFNSCSLTQLPFHISVSYKHSPQYHITHLTREAMVSVQLDKSQQSMPVNAVGRRSHYVLDAENFVGDRIIDNSYNPNTVFCDTD